MRQQLLPCTEHEFKAKQARIDEACAKMTMCLHDLGLRESASSHEPPEGLVEVTDRLCRAAYAEHNVRITSELARTRQIPVPK